MRRRYRAAYPPEFRQHMVELHRAGNSLHDLAKEFEPSLDTITFVPTMAGFFYLALVLTVGHSPATMSELA